MDVAKEQQQIVEKIKASTNILVTVSRDPSVDELSAALGLTAMLDKLDKHATAIFSGATPPAITFLDPEKTFESTADSLQDFIIALNKEKADHLRYKVEGDVVKIFITPYRTTITSEDLEFSQGDYNVELVLALGVENQDNLDAALEAHGRILHDATVTTLSAGDQTSTLGSIDWHDASASSLCEMVVSLGDQIKADKPLLDDQVATALLTGIVASTDRFSNPRTTSKVMTMAAQLMAAGADQQLIAAKLQESHEIAAPSAVNSSGETKISEGSTVKLTAESTLPPDDHLAIDHSAPAEATPPVVVPVTPEVANPSPQPASIESTLPPEATPESTLPTDKPIIAPISPDLTKSSDQSSASESSTLPPQSGDSAAAGVDQLIQGNTELSQEPKPVASSDVDENKDVGQDSTTSAHSYLDPSASSVAPINGATEAVYANKSIDIFANPVNSSEPQAAKPKLEPLSESARDHDDARAAIEAALGDSSGTPTINPTPPAPAFAIPPPPAADFSTMPPPLPDFSSPVPPQPAVEQPQPERLGDIFPPQPTQQPAVQPNIPAQPAPTLPPQQLQPAASAANDPGQYQIPGSA